MTADHRFAALLAEFPEFALATLPAIPAEWTDSSWHNDACPSFRIGQLTIWVDFKNPAQRECPGYKRFAISHADHAEQLFASDYWSAVLAAVKRLQTVDSAARA